MDGRRVAERDGVVNQTIRRHELPMRGIELRERRTLPQRSVAAESELVSSAGAVTGKVGNRIAVRFAGDEIERVNYIYGGNLSVNGGATITGNGVTFGGRTPDEVYATQVTRRNWRRN